MNEINNDLSAYKWVNPPAEFELDDQRLKVVSSPHTDFWQRTHYGFSRDNGHHFVQKVEQDFTFVVRVTFSPNKQYDQCGVIIRYNSDCWMKGGIEAEDDTIFRLGSVVTLNGFSDWASTDVSAQLTSLWYRLSGRGADFLMEYSMDGICFHQMRIFHLRELREGLLVGVYACSPLDSTFKAEFSAFQFSPCSWAIQE